MSETRTRFDAMQHPVPVRIDHETPSEFFAALDAEFGFTLDVCATPQNAKCARFLTPEDDALTTEWGTVGDVCWMNPPYGKAIEHWMAAAHFASMAGRTVVCLIPARTDTRWWHRYTPLGEVRFVKGRIRFVGSKFNAPFPSAVVIFRASLPPEAPR